MSVVLGRRGVQQALQAGRHGPRTVGQKVQEFKAVHGFEPGSGDIISDAHDPFHVLAGLPPNNTGELLTQIMQFVGFSHMGDRHYQGQMQKLLPKSWFGKYLGQFRGPLLRDQHQLQVAGAHIPYRELTPAAIPHVKPAELGNLIRKAERRIGDLNRAVGGTLTRGETYDDIVTALNAARIPRHLQGPLYTEAELRQALRYPIGKPKGLSVLA